MSKDDGSFKIYNVSMSSYSSLSERQLLHLIQQEPNDLSKIIQALNESWQHLPDTFFDILLGLTITTTERTVDQRNLEQRYGREQYTYEGTPYDYIRTFLSILAPKADDIIYDLGSGYGRIVLYGALITEMCYNGIEIVSERVIEARRIKERFHIGNANFAYGNILGQTYKDGTIFFLFNPFAEATLRRVITELQSIAAHHPIRIVTWGGGASNDFLRLPWLKEFRPQRPRWEAGLDRLKFFTSS